MSNYNNIIQRKKVSKDNIDELVAKSYKELIKSTYESKFQKWFNLKEISKLKNISYRSLKYMVGSIYRKYNDQGLISREGRRYYISYLLLDQFKLVRPRKASTIYSHDWKSNIAWTTVDKYDVAYHECIFQEIKNTLIEVNFLGCIEQDLSGRNHVHLIADSPAESLKTPLQKIIEQYLDDERHYRLYCNQINNIGGSVDYLLKNPQKLIK